MDSFFTGGNWEAIVLRKKKYKDSTDFTFFTKERGIISCRLSNRRIYSFKGSGYLQPFSHVIVTVREDGGNYQLLQLDGLQSAKRVGDSLLSISYTSLVVELLIKLFKEDGREKSVFPLLVSYSRTLSERSIPLASIILGWQILSKAGFLPSAEDIKKEVHLRDVLKEVYFVTGIKLSDGAIEGLINLLQFDWKSQTELRIRKEDWLLLERTLYDFAAFQIGEPLESVIFLSSMKLTIFS